VHLTARLDSGESAKLGATADWTQVLPSGSVPFVPAHVDVAPLAVRGEVDPQTVADSRDALVFADATSVIASEREMEAANAYAAGDVARAQSLIDKNVADLHAAQAAAPAPVAAQLEKQVTVYDETKKSFHAPPGSGAGRVAAKRAFQNDWANLARTAY